MDNDIKISVIIPNYNNAKYIEECLKSVVNQTIKNIEIIVVDDGSTDESVNVVEKFISNNPQLSITLIKQFNQNGAVARNRGLEIAKGKFVYFLDSDDSIDNENVFNKIINDIEDCDLLIGNYEIVNEIGNNIETYENNKHVLDCKNDVFKYSIQSPVPSNKLYKKDVIDKYNIYFDNVRIGQDLNFYIKYLAVCKKIKSVDYSLYKYRIISTSMTRTKNLNLFDIVIDFDYIKKFYNKNNLNEEYDKYISLVELIHYESQMKKIRNYKDISTKRMIYKFFKYFVKKIKFKKFYDKKIIRKEYLKYKTKCLLKYIYYR